MKKKTTTAAKMFWKMTYTMLQKTIFLAAMSIALETLKKIDSKTVEVVRLHVHLDQKENGWEAGRIY